MKLEYRRGSAEDKDELQALGLLSYGQHQKALTQKNWEELHALIADPETFTYLMSSSTSFVCEFEKEIIGMAFLVPQGYPTAMFEENWSYIRMVGVNPKFGGRGIAKTLTRTCINYAKESGESYVALHTSEFMDAARHIYEGFGFKIVKELTRYDKTYWIYLLEL